ncbi:hypothetical protein Snov_0164 [Ancylobacter novellus DSM 506]|uniref:Uncharacterized protein n=1 Tax=Ancylobacter novellus (strain ATCC 8093 / DSM 506 / JCM 20403 / CCM 1077 / IAM 12100 / NBRC 12443 / NCIMB 10456) TaxID=639283 RepID=D7A0Z0_ANCN5|nr:hypothetical protein Snov_0164 [Ancylobacter novellus DSM 506]
MRLSPRRLLRPRALKEADQRDTGAENVLAGEPGGLVGVAGDAGFQYALVLAARARHAVGQHELGTQVAVDAVQRGADGLQVVGPRGRLVERIVEAAVELAPVRGIRLRGECIGEALGVLEPLVRDALHRIAQDFRLQQGAEFEDLADLVGRERGDHGAAVALRRHQALLLETRQRLAHRDAADVEQAGDVVLPKGLAFGNVALGDGLAQRVENDVRRGCHLRDVRCLNLHLVSPPGFAADRLKSPIRCRQVLCAACGFGGRRARGATAQ